MIQGTNRSIEAFNDHQLLTQSLLDAPFLQERKNEHTIQGVRDLTNSS